MRLRWGLAAKLAGGLALGSVLFFFFFGLAHQRIEQRHLEGLVRLSAERISDIIRWSAWQHMMANDRPGLYELIRNLGKEPGVLRLRLMNENGLIRHSTQASEIGTIVDRRAEACYACHSEAAPRIALSGKERTRIFRNPDGRRILAAILPIENAPDCSNAACHAHPASRRILGVIDVHLTLDNVDTPPGRVPLPDGPLYGGWRGIPLPLRRHVRLARASPPASGAHGRDAEGGSGRSRLPHPGGILR